jgi:hypothetical protein
MTINIKDVPGYWGAYTDDEAPGAYRNGTRIVKDVSEAGDATLTGATGKVLGSVSARGSGIAYFVEWDDRPGVAVLVVAVKIRAV